MLVALDATVFNRRHFFLAAAIAGCLFPVASNWSSGADGEPMFQRFAIMATGDIQGTGLSDLLTAKLSVVEGVELVEREQLASAIKEQELSACFNSTAAPQRLKLGRLLEADVLILLSRTTPVRAVEPSAAKPSAAGTRVADAPPAATAGATESKESSLRVVISDCIYGARLHVDYFPFDVDALDEVANKCASVVLETRQRFAAGVERLIGVTHFLSKNLTHDHDHLQAGYAALLENSLNVFPGVGVIEIDEARAISQELSLSGGELKRTAVPVFVQGEFKITHADGREPAVWLSVRLTEANRAGRQFERDALTEAQVVDLLTGELPRQVLEMSNELSTEIFSRPQLKRLLTARADAFSSAGAYEDGTAMREAALLLGLDDLPQRIRLIRDYDRWQMACDRENTDRMLAANRQRMLGGTPEDHAETWARTHAERMARFRMTVPHVEYLMRRRRVNPREATELVSGTVSSMKLAALTVERAHGSEDKQALEEFFWRVCPLFPQLDSAQRDGTLHAALQRNSGKDAWSAERQRQNWTKFAITFLVELAPRCTSVGLPPSHRDYSRTLGHLHRFLTELPQNELPIPAMARVSMESMNSLIAAGNLKSDQVRGFLEQLRQAKSPWNAFYARCGLLALRVHGQNASGAELRAELAELLAIVDRIDAERPEDRLVAWAYRRALERLQAEIAPGRVVSSRVDLPCPDNPIPAPDPSPPISFTPTGIPAPWRGWARCGDSLDLMWSFDGVDVMRGKGAAQRVFQLDAKQRGFTAEDMVYSAHWDGQNIWIATMKSGVIVVSPTGRTLARVHQQQGLPPYNAEQLPLHLHGYLAGAMSHTGPLRLQPVAPGKCLAAGRFGPHRRLWFAMISKGEDGEYGVDVFHQATRIVKQPTETDIADPTVVFPLHWTALYSDPNNPNRRWWLFARTIGRASVERPALAIELDTCIVSLFPSRFPPAYSGLWPRLQVGRSLLLSSATKIVVVTPSGEGDPPREWVAKTILDHSGSPPDQRQRIVFAHDRVVYNPGYYWRRIRRNGLALDVINDVPTALKHRFEFYASSTHYGVVAWNRSDQLYQVSFERPENTDLATRYPFVPAAQRERHHQAILAIRKLGGSVGTRWGVAPYQYQRPEEPRWRTLVYLPADWAGGDAGLAHLDDLHNLNELYLVEADISDQGLRYVGQLRDLESLHLVSPKATDSGIAHLQSLPKLTYCRLQGTPDGSELDDGVLQHLNKLPRLIALALVGRGFTDAGLAHLQDRRTVRELLLHDTSITPAGIAVLKETKPWLRVSERIPN